MAEDYYSDGPPVSGPTDNGAEAKEETDAAQTALLPKSFFPGGETEPGKECTVRVARVHDDQVEVEYVHSPEGDELPEAPAEEPAQPPMGMASMME